MTTKKNRQVTWEAKKIRRLRRNIKHNEQKKNKKRWRTEKKHHLLNFDAVNLSKKWIYVDSVKQNFKYEAVKFILAHFFLSCVARVVDYFGSTLY